MGFEKTFLNAEPVAPPAADDSWLAVDAAKALGAGITDLAAQAVGAVADLRNPTEMTGEPRDQRPAEGMRATQNYLNATTEAIDDSIGQANRKAGESALVPTEEDQQSFFTSPGKATVMKAARMAPMLLSAFFLPQGWAGVAAGSAFFGAQGVAQQLNDTRKRIDTMPEEDLLKSPIYTELRGQMDEPQAREEFIKGLNDVGSLLMAGGANAAGGGAIAHALKGQAAKSLLKGAGVGALEGVSGGAVMGAGMETAKQRTDIRGGLDDRYHAEKIALAALNAGFEVGALGVAAGAVGSRGATRAAARDKANGTVVEPNAPDPAQRAALAADEAPDTTTSTEAPATPQAPTSVAGAVEGAPAGPLAKQIAEERARAAAAPVEGAPVAPPVTPVDPNVPPMPTPVMPARVPEAAAPVVPEAPYVPNPRTEQLVPPPPTDTMLAPRRKAPPPERMAVPLEDVPVDVPVAPSPDAPLRAPEVEAAVATMPQKKVVEAVPETKAETTGVPAIDDMNAALAAEPAAPPVTRRGPKKPVEVIIKKDPAAPKAVTAEMIPTEPGKPRVFRIKDELTEKAAAARVELEQGLTEGKGKAFAADAKRAQRARNVILPLEKRAEEHVKSRMPTDVDSLVKVGTVDDAAMKGDAKARTEVLSRARETIELAEKAGMKIPQRTTKSTVVKAEGTANPTPYTSHLIETKRFIKRMEDAARDTKDPARQERKIREAMTDFITTERAMRAGDLEGAAARRLEANAANEGRRAASERTKAEADELARLMDDQRADAEGKNDGDFDDLDSVLQREEGGRDRAEFADENYSERAKDGSGTSKGKATPKLYPDLRESVRSVFTDFKETLRRSNSPQATLMMRIMDRVAAVVGDHDIVFTTRAQHNAMRKRLGMDPVSDTVEGVFIYEKAGTRSDGKRGEIYVIRDNITNDASHMRVPIHETVHAATVHAIHNNPKLYAELEQMMTWAYHQAQKADRNTEPEVLSWFKVPKDPKAHTLSQQYGMRNPFEFVAEALSNPKFQRLLMETDVPRPVAQAWGLQGKPSIWQALVTRIADFLGIGRKSMNLLEAILLKSDDMLSFDPVRGDFNGGRPAEARSERTDAAAREVRDFVASTPATVATKLRSLGLKLATVQQIAQKARGYFGEGTPADRLERLMGQAATEKERILNSGDRKLVSDLATAQRQTAPDAWDRFARFLHDETMAGTFADADPPKGTAMRDWQAAARHADLKRDFDALPDNLKKLRTRLHKYFRERQNDLSRERIKNIVRAINDGIPDDALATRIFEGKLDAAEKAVLEKDAVFQAIKDARAMSKITGPYVPLMRRGDHVVAGRYQITSPGNAVRLNGDGARDAQGNIFQFKTKDEAKAFVQAQDAKVMEVRRVYLDKETGERWSIDEDGAKHKLTKEDFGWGQADEAYRVKLQDRHLEFFERQSDAARRHAELGQMGLEMEGVAPRRWEPGGSNASFMSEAFTKALNSLKQRKGFQELDEAAQRALVEHLRDASLAAMGSTRVQSRRLPRTFVAGASNDIMTNTGQYASTSAGYLSRLKFQPRIDAAMKEMTDFEAAHRYEGTERTYPRGQILKELKERLYNQSEPEAYGFWQSAGNRLLQLSFLDKLASPAFHMINAAEPWTISMPVLAGRFGVGRTISELNRAYRDIGAGSAAGAGFMDTGRALKSGEGLTNYLQRFQDRLRKQPDGKHVSALLDDLYDTGLLSRDAGMEIGRMSTPNSPLVGRALDRADLMARQMGTAIESINRTVTAVAAYRLEYRRNGDHAAAMKFAREKVIDTMGDYAGWNAAPIFNHPIGRLALQFKKYAQKTYFLLGKTAGAALRGDKEAMKAFAGIMATHVSVAGMLGMPLEPIKAGFIAANLMGLTNSNYSDFEQWAREIAAKNLGVGGGQIVTRGLPRYLGVDLSSRMGLESLIFPMGEPKSRKPDDLLAYAAKAFAGAPIGMIMEYPSGVQAIWEGKVAEGLEKLVPLKMWADSLQAYRKFEEGKRTPTGRETMSPYSGSEVVRKVMGFTPGREAEEGELRGAMMGDQRRQREDRSKLVSRWVMATPAEKSAMWRQIQSWNDSQPEAARIKLKELTSAQQRREREKKDANNEFGIRTSSREQHIREGAQYYNVR